MDQVIVQVHPSRMNIMVRKLTGNKKRATCLATLVQNELNSDVASFTSHIAINQVVRVVFV